MTRTDSRIWGQTQIAVAMAGIVGERLAWPVRATRTHVRRAHHRRLAAYHEAAHAVTAIVAREIVITVALDPPAERFRQDDRPVGGVCVLATDAEFQNSERSESAPTEIKSDAFWISGLARLMGQPRDRVRAIRGRVEVILFENWGAVEALADALLDRGALTQSEIEEIVRPRLQSAA